MTPQESLHRDYGLLAGFLRSLSIRFQLRTILEFLLLLPSGFILVLLGSLFVLELRETFPYLPLFYSLVATTFLSLLSLLGLWRFLSKPSLEHVAKGLEEKFPDLKDDVTNSLLLFDEMEKGKGFGQFSEGLVTAQLKKTVSEVHGIQAQDVVSLKGALKHLRLLLPLVLTFSLVFAFAPQFLGRSLALILHPLSHLPMKRTFISVEPQGSIVLRGTPVIIKAKATGNVPHELTLEAWPEDGKVMRFPMEPEGEGRFNYRMAAAQFSLQYQVCGGRASSPVYTIRVVDPPEVGRVKLTLIPPDYTHLPREIRQEGHIEALKGTMVNLEAKTNKPVLEGRVVLNQGNQLALNVQGDHLAGSLAIFYPGTYSIHVKDELGFENPNPVQYRIHLLPDKYPEVDIISPGQDLEVLGTEVTRIIYTAKDDFGITAVRLSYQMGGIERFITLKNIGSSSRSLSPETFKWDLTGLALTPGERVVYRLEVWDNDSISGPKVGYSRTFTLYVRDERDRASKEAEEAQRIADALLDLLADQLEETKDKEELSQRLKKVLEQVDKNLGRMAEDKIERYDLEALKRNLAFLNKRIHEEPKEKVTRELERLALLAEGVAKKVRMSEVEALAREIRNRERRLIDTLRDFKGPLSPKALEAMMKELDKLRQLLQTVMDAMSKMATQLPNEFINSPDLKGMDFQDLFKDLDEIQKMLMAGDLAGALEAAQRLLQTLSEMMAALSRAGAQANMGSFDRLQGEMASQTSELERILGEQKEILSGTERIDRETKRLVEEETEKRLSHSLPRFQESLEGLHRSLPAEQSDEIEELEKLLKERHIERFSELAKSLEKELLGRHDIQNLMEELRKMVDNLSPDPRELIPPDNKEKFPGLSFRQESLEKRTKYLTEKLEMLSQLFPGMDTEILDDLKQATDFMEKAAGRLKGEDAPGAIPPEQEAIRSLTRSQQAMQQMAQRMAQQMAMQMQNRWGYPSGYDPGPGWYYGPWVPMPTLPQPEVRRPRERGYTGIDREEFDPPSKDAYKAPQILREKIMESLKESIPSQYRREVERYFKGLTE